MAKGEINLDQQLALNIVLHKMETLEKQDWASIGDHIVITDNTNSHEFEIGQECVVCPWDWFSEDEDRDAGVEASPVNGGEHWFVRHTDYKKVED